MNWTQSNTIAMAKTGCEFCNGLGLGASSAAPCKCVLRAVYRACRSRFVQCMHAANHAGTVKLEFTGGRAENRQVFGRRNEEYCADFALVSKRYLNEKEYKLFRYHVMLGADAKLIARREQVPEWAVQAAISSMEAKLGAAYSSVRPYTLFPLDEYFSQVLHNGVPSQGTPEPRFGPLRPPMLSPA